MSVGGSKVKSDNVMNRICDVIYVSIISRKAGLIIKDMQNDFFYDELVQGYGTDQLLGTIRSYLIVHLIF